MTNEKEITGQKGKFFFRYWKWVIRDLSFHIRLKVHKSVYTGMSPDRATVLEVKTDANGKLLYRMLYSGDEVVTWSSLGFQIHETASEEKNEIKGKTQKNNKEIFSWSLGEDDMIVNKYNEVRLFCQSSISYHIITRLYDGSVAFRYEIPEQAGYPHIRINREKGRHISNRYKSQRGTSRYHKSQVVFL